jgi:hypothetical protein
MDYTTINAIKDYIKYKTSLDETLNPLVSIDERDSGAGPKSNTNRYPYA